MELALSLLVRAREGLVRNCNAQTMTEYVMILTAVAAAAYGIYHAMGNSVSSLANGADSLITSA